MRKICMVYGIFVVLFCAIHGDSAVAATTSGIERSLLKNEIVEPLLGRNTWEQESISASVMWPEIPYFYNWHVHYDYDPYSVGCSSLAVAQVMRFFEHPKTPPKTFFMSEGESLIGQDFKVYHDPDESEITTKIMGGSGPNGSYNWVSMDINPLPENYLILSVDAPIKNPPSLFPNSHEAKVRNEIASLLHDLGALMNLKYSREGTGPGLTIIQTKHHRILTEYLGYSSAIESSFFRNKSIQDVLKTNLQKGYPVLMSCTVEEIVNGINKSYGHIFVVDGYGYKNSGDRKGQTEYYRLNLGWGGGGYKDLWYPLSSFPIILDASKGMKLDTFSWLPGSVRLLYNIMPDQKNKEIYAGHVTLGNNTDLANLELEVSYTPSSQMGSFSVNESATEKIIISTDAKGDFAFLIPSNSTIHSVTAKASNIKIGEMRSHLRKSYPDYNFTGESTSAEISGDEIIKEGTVGNKYFDIVFDTAAIVGVENGLLNGIGREYDYPLPFAAANAVGNNWDFSGLKALYVDPFPYSLFVGQAWFSNLCIKIRDFVMNDGGTVYLTSDSHPIVQYLSTQAGAGLQLFASPPYPIYQGNAYTEIILKDSLSEKLTRENINIPYIPHAVDGPLIQSMGSKCTLLAMANVAFMAGGLNYRFEKFPCAVMFPLGRGRVFYSSFPIPENIAGGVIDPITDQTPLQAFAD